MVNSNRNFQFLLAFLSIKHFALISVAFDFSRFYGMMNTPPLALLSSYAKDAQNPKACDYHPNR
jgi:hypothetical protein